MSEEDPESSTPEKDINSESLSHQSAHSLEDEEDQPDEYTNYQQNQDISDKNEEEIIENENNEIKDPNILGENDNKYIAMIEGLEDELYIEQYITKSLKKDPDFNEEVNKLKNELVNKNNKLEQLKLINKKQENTLIEFRAKLKKEKTMNNKVIINNGTNDKLNNNINLREVSKNEAMNNAIKNKDSDLTNVLNKMNLLKKENEDLKKKLEEEKENNNNNSVITTTNNSNVFETEIKFRNSSDFKKILANFETELKKSRSEFCSKINEEIKEIKNKFDKLEENYKVINDERKSLKKEVDKMRKGGFDQDSYEAVLREQFETMKKSFMEKLENLNEELNNVKQESRVKIYQVEEEMKECNYLKNVFLNQLVTLQAKLENNN